MADFNPNQVAILIMNLREEGNIFLKKLKLIGSLGLMLFIGGGVCATHVSGMERHAVYLERNYADKQGEMH